MLNIALVALCACIMRHKRFLRMPLSKLRSNVKLAKWIRERKKTLIEFEIPNKREKKRAIENEESRKERLTRRNQLDRANREAETLEQKERLEKRRERRNEVDRARREAETEEQKERLEKRRERRNEVDRARREAETEEQKERLEKRREKRKEVDRARREAETEEQKKERLEKRRERDRARRQAKKSEEKVEKSFFTIENPDIQNLPIPSVKKRLSSGRNTTPAELQQKRQKLSAEDEDSRASRLKHLSDYHTERMEVESQEKRDARLEHASYLQQLRLPMETDDERATRLELMSSCQQIRLSRETEDERAARISQERRKVDIHWDGHLPLLEQHHVQATMNKFHQEMAKLESPVCSTCMEKFPGMNTSIRSSECLRCARDKHVPKLFSANNNMHPGVVPPQLQVL